MSTDINPWELFLSDTAMDTEIAYRNLFAFTSVKRTADTLQHIHEKRLKENDFEFRDIILTGKRQEEWDHPSLFDYAKSHYKGLKSFDSAIKYDATMRECVRRKYFFWRNVLKQRPETKEKQDSKEQVIQAVRGYKLPTQLLFAATGFGIAYLLGLYNNPLSFRIMCIGTGLMFGTFYGEFKYATEIFDSLPRLPDKELEQERQDIYNYCFSLDVKLIATALSKEEGLDNMNQVTVSEKKEPAKK